jgi:methylenetetrahydrofolate--tRNA-(uracil-5-)-methyltransferase
MREVHVIGAGLAGCEAAGTLAGMGHRVKLFEQKPRKFSPAHINEGFAELVCSNSFKAARVESAAGLLKAEMRLMGSLCLNVADRCAVPAGGALAVDRALFSEGMTREIEGCPNIEVIRRVVEDIDPEAVTVVATGPLTDGALAARLEELCGERSLSFYDAAAPIILADSIDKDEVYAASRYDRGEDYLNCYFDRQGYEAFHGALASAETARLRDFEDFAVYEGCMPIERLAKRGVDAMRFGPLKPVGLTDPRTGRRPWAAVQLRRENREGTMYNLVGFQTNLTFGEQKRVFALIPGLKRAEFARYGTMHRNTFLNSPRVLSRTLGIKRRPGVFVAGQLTGFEGYMESAASGILAGRFAGDYLAGRESLPPGRRTMCGALLEYITSENSDFQPMGANMGVLPALEEEIRDKQERYTAFAVRALRDMGVYLS